MWLQIIFIIAIAGQIICQDAPIKPLPTDPPRTTTTTTTTEAPTTITQPTTTEEVPCTDKEIPYCDGVPCPDEMIPKILVTTNKPEKEESKHCPVGFVHDGKKCVQRDWDNCPKDYVWRDNHCLLERIVCPTNFKLINSLCVEQEVCPPTHTLDDKKRCVAKDPDCPEGFRWNGVRCETINIQCQDGSMLIDGKCVFETITCPNGYTYDSVKGCLKAPSCELGYEYDITQELCIQVTWICPEGSVLVNGTCSTWSFECPKGMDLIDNVCRRNNTCNNECSTTTTEASSTTTSFPLDNSTDGNDITTNDGELNTEVPTNPPVLDVTTNKPKVTSTTTPSNLDKNPPSPKPDDQKPCPPNINCLPDGQNPSNPCCNNPLQPCPPEIPTDQKPCIPNKPCPPHSDKNCLPNNPNQPCTPDLPKYQYPCYNNPNQYPCYPSYTPQPPPYPNVCPEGFLFYNHKCYRCPESYNFCDGFCLKNTIPCNVPYTPYPPSPGHPNININIKISHDKRSPSDEKKHVIQYIDPVNNTIVNFNNFTHPITLNNVNENNIHIYTDTQCADGTIRTTIIRNNETISGCTDVDAPADSTTKKRETELEGDDDDDDNENEEEEEEDKSKCCEIVTPRKCKKRSEDQWMCSHRRYKYCGKFCIADRLYMRPPSTTYKNQILTIAPSPENKWIKPCYGRECPAVGKF